MRTMILGWVVLGLAAIAGAQPSPDVVWERTYGGSAADQFHGMARLEPAGYVFGGHTYSETHGDCDLWLVRTAENGEQLWSRTYGGAAWDYGWAVAATPDGRIAVAGVTESFEANGEDMLLVVTNLDGVEQWHRRYGDGGDEVAYSVIRASNGGYVLAGSSTSFGAGPDFFLVKTNAEGNPVWTRHYGGPGQDVAFKVCETPDHGYILAGYTTSFGAGERDVYVIKTNAEGDLTWSRTFGGEERDYALSVIVTADGGYLVGGVTNTFSNGYSDAYLIKLSPAGEPQWTRHYAADPASAACMDLLQAPDGNYLVPAITGAPPYDAWLFMLNPQGEMLWSRVHGGPGEQWFVGSVPAHGGGFVVAGALAAQGWAFKFGEGEPPPPEHHFQPVPPTGLPYAIVIDSARVDGEPLHPGDEVAVFDGNLCVGAASVGPWPLTITAWQGDPEHELPGFTAGHPIQFRVWVREPNVDVEATATYTAGDGNFGTGAFTRASLTAAAQTVQVIPLRANYAELISLGVRPGPDGAPGVFGDIEGLLAVYNSRGGVFIPPDVNTIGELQPTAGYRLYCTQAETLRVSGLPLNPDLAYPLEPERWQWISYPLPIPVPVAQALSEIAEHVVIVQNDDGLVWIPGEEVNTLELLVPGEGYMIIVDAPTLLRFQPSQLLQVPPSPLGGRHAIRVPPRAPQPTGIPFSVLIRLSADLAAEQPDMVALFDGDVCTGAACLTSDATTPATAWAAIADLGLGGYTPGHAITARVYTADGRELPVRILEANPVYGSGAYQTLTLQSDGGDAVVPQQFRVSEAYPNPFNPSVSIQYALPEAGQVEFLVFNALGQQVYHASRAELAGEHEFTLNAGELRPPLVSGIYFAQVRFAGHSEMRKIVLIK